MLRELFCLVSFSFYHCRHRSYHSFADSFSPFLLSSLALSFFSFSAFCVCVQWRPWTDDHVHIAVAAATAVQMRKEMGRKNAMHATTLPLFHRPTLLRSLFCSFSLFLSLSYVYVHHKTSASPLPVKEKDELLAHMPTRKRARALCVNVIVKKAIIHLASTWKRERGRAISSFCSVYAYMSDNVIVTSLFCLLLLNKSIFEAFFSFSFTCTMTTTTATTYKTATHRSCFALAIGKINNAVQCLFFIDDFFLFFFFVFGEDDDRQDLGHSFVLRRRR